MTYTLSVTSAEGIFNGIPTGQPGSISSGVSLTVPDSVVLSGVEVSFSISDGGAPSISPSGSIISLESPVFYGSGISGGGLGTGEFSIQHGELSGSFSLMGFTEGFIPLDVSDGDAQGLFGSDNPCSTDGHGGPVNTCTFQGTFEPDRLLVPEPASMSLLGAGLALLGATRHRRRR